MRTLLCGFALGVCWLQQSADLPKPDVLVAWLIFACLSYGAAFTLQKKCRALYGWLRCRMPRLAQRATSVRLFELSALILVFIATLVVGYSFAAWRAAERLAYSLPIQFEQQDLQITGVIVGLPTVQQRVTHFAFAIENGSPQHPLFPKLIQLSWYAQPDSPVPPLQIGERWALTVRLKRVHGTANEYGYDFEATMLTRNVRATGYVRARPEPHWLGQAHGFALTVQGWRATVRERIAQALPQAPHAGVITALAMGWQAGIAADDWQLFTRTGTNHLVAISGLHISLVAGFAGTLAGWLWRQLGWLSARGLLWLAAPRMAALVGLGAGTAYAVLAGLGVPAQRALIMLFVAVVAGLSSREVGASTILAWTLAVVLLIDPWAVLSAGFWLSFGAVAIILSVAHTQMNQLKKSLPQLQTQHFSNQHQLIKAAFVKPLTFSHFANSVGEWFKTRSKKFCQILCAAAQIQGAVTLGLTPLTALWFAQTSLISPLANAFAIPWVSFLVTPLVLAGIVLPAPLDGWAFKAAHLSFAPLAELMSQFAAQSWAWWPLPAPTVSALVLALLGTLIWIVPCRWWWRVAALLLFAPLTLAGRRMPVPGEFRLTVLDVGQGAATLVETAHHRLLFDTGPRYDATADAGQRIVLPYLRSAGIKHLDTLVISHADSDHEGGAQTIFSAVPAKQLRASLPEQHPLWSMAQTKSDAARCQAGESWAWDGIKFTMLWPDIPQLRGVHNAGSCVLRVENDQHAALLTGDIEAPEERALIKSNPSSLRATLLIAPHHGSRTSSTELFLDAVAPHEAVFQVGYRNRFHHPNSLVLARYKAHGINLHRNDRDGAISFETQRRKFIVERYRQMRRRYWMGR